MAWMSQESQEPDPVVATAAAGTRPAWSAESVEFGKHDDVTTAGGGLSGERGAEDHVDGGQGAGGQGVPSHVEVDQFVPGDGEQSHLATDSGEVGQGRTAQDAETRDGGAVQNSSRPSAGERDAALLAAGSILAAGVAAGQRAPEKQREPVSGVWMEPEPMWTEASDRSRPDHPGRPDQADSTSAGEGPDEDPEAGWDEGSADFIAALLGHGRGSVEKEPEPTVVLPPRPPRRLPVSRPVETVIAPTASSAMPNGGFPASSAASQDEEDEEDEDDAEDEDRSGPGGLPAQTRPFAIADLLEQDDAVWGR